MRPGSYLKTPHFHCFQVPAQTIPPDRYRFNGKEGLWTSRSWKLVQVRAFVSVRYCTIAQMCIFFLSHRDAFIYEYVGDVLSSPSMKKRMREYGKEGIQHFYFMMLQKDEVRLCFRLSQWALNGLPPRVVYRRDQEGWDREICEPQLQPQLLRRKMDHRGSSANGNIFQEGYLEG